MRIYLLILGASLALFSCKLKKDSSNSTTSELSKDAVANRQFTALYIKATNEAMIENFDKAIELYEKCRDLDPKNGAVYYELSRIYAKKRNAQLAFDNANKAHELSPKNKYFLLQKATVLNRTGQNNQAMQAYEDLLEVDPKNLPVLYELAELYKRDFAYIKAAETIDRIEGITGKNPRMSYQKYLFYMDGNEFEKGIAVIEEMLKKNPASGLANLAMAQHYEKTGQKEKVYDKLVYAFEDVDIKTDMKLSVLMDYNKRVNTDEKARKEALNLINIMKRVHPKDVKTYVVTGDFYSNTGDLKMANSYYKKGLEYSTKAYPIYLQLMDNSYNLKEYDSVVNYAEMAIESYPTQPVFYLYKGMGYKELKNYDKAISAFKTGKNVVIDDEKIEFDFLSKMGETYHEMGNHKESDKAFEKAMEINGLEPFMLNNYSYYLSLRKENLERAAYLSKKANSIYPTNASFNDTYGWILYQQEKYQDAANWIKKSLDNGGDKSGTVLEHYGDVLFKIDGNASRALEYWQKAKLAGDYSEELDNKIESVK